MNTFKIEKYGDTQYQLQYTSKSGFGTHIICTAEELAQLRELLAPMAWQDKPSGEGKYVWITESGDMRPALIYTSVWDGRMKVSWDKGGRYDDLYRSGNYPSGLWLKLPDVPENKAA